MRKLLVLTVLLAAAPLRAQKGGQGQAPEKPTPQQMAQRHADEMATHLDLNADQKQKVEKVIEESMPEMMELQEKMHKLQRTMHEKIRALLNDDQKEKFDMMRMGQMHPGMGPGGPGGMGGMRGRKGMMGPGSQQQPQQQQAPQGPDKDDIPEMQGPPK